MNKNKLIVIWSIISIIIGLYFMTTSAVDVYIKDVSFGADFYTDTYQGIRDVVRALNRVNEGIHVVVHALGALMIIQGVYNIIRLKNDKEDLVQIKVKTKPETKEVAETVEVASTEADVEVEPKKQVKTESKIKIVYKDNAETSDNDTENKA